MKSVDNIKKEVKSEGESDVGETGAKSWSTERKKKDTPVSLESLKQAADNLRKRPPTLPSILQYNSHSKQRYIVVMWLECKHFIVVFPEKKYRLCNWVF